MNVKTGHTPLSITPGTGSNGAIERRSNTQIIIAVLISSIAGAAFGAVATLVLRLLLHLVGQGGRQAKRVDFSAFQQ